MKSKRISRKIALFIALALTWTVCIPEGGTAWRIWGISTAQATSSSLFKIEGTELVSYLGKGTKKTVTVPDGVKTIGARAFKDDEMLQKVNLPDSVKEIGEKAFSGCVNLRKVVISANSKLKTIGARAFQNCVSLDTSFATKVKNVDSTAFKGIEVEPDPEPTEEPEPEPEPVYIPTGGTRQTHGKSTVVTTHDYDQVWVHVAGEEAQQSMHTLTLAGEELEVTLDGAAGEARNFTVALYDWDTATPLDLTTDKGGNTLILTAVTWDAAAAEPETGADGSATPELSEPSRTETTTAPPESEIKEEATAAPAEMTETRTEAATEPGKGALEPFTWRMNGAALRKLSKSGVEYLVLRTGEQLVAVPTEGFLGGWVYDELRSLGTAGRRFDYAMTTDGVSAPVWSVTVEEKSTYEPGEDVLAPLYLIGVETGTEKMLSEPKGT